MSDTIKICPKCNETGNNLERWRERNRPQEFCDYNQGIIGAWWVFEKNLDNCCYCNSPLHETDMPTQDFHDIAKVSNYNRQLLEAMIDLKQKDIIEYELKMGQFRAQVQQQNVAAKQSREESNKPKCPKCGSTAITAGQRGYSIWTGFLGSSATVNRCSNCGHKWKPSK